MEIVRQLEGNSEQVIALKQSSILKLKKIVFGSNSRLLPVQKVINLMFHL